MLMDCGWFFESCWGKNIYFPVSSFVACAVFPQSYKAPFKVFCNTLIPSLTSAERPFLNKERNATFQSWVYGQIMSKISKAILQMILISQLWCSLASQRPQLRREAAILVGARGDDVAPGADLDRLMTVITQPSSGLRYSSSRGIKVFWEWWESLQDERKVPKSFLGIHGCEMSCRCAEDM